MSTNDYPNQEAFRDANNIYLDVMRSFIKHHLRQVTGATVEDLIREALYDNQLDKFEEMLEEHKKVEFAIDFNFIPQIIKEHWNEIFEHIFDEKLVDQNRLWIIRQGRNKCEHRGPDLDPEFTRAHLYNIAKLFKNIRKSDKQQEIEAIRDQLLLDHAAKEIAEISEKLNASENDKKKLQKELAEKKQNLEKMEETQSQSEKELKILRGIETEKEESDNRVSKLKKEVKEFEEMWQLSEENLKITQKRLQEVEKERDSFEERFTGSEQQYQDVKKQKKADKEKLETLGEELTKIKSEKKSAENQIATLENLLGTISIDSQKVGLVYPPLNTDSLFHILDRRNTPKQNYLLQLLELRKPTLIYVQDDEMVNNCMKLIGHEKMEVIKPHYRYTTEDEEREMLEKLENGELIAIVSNDVFSTLTTTHCVKHFVFCHLSRSLETLIERCKPAFTSSQTAFLHFIYHSDNRDENNNWITQKYPTHKYPKRAELEALYKDLKHFIGIDNKYITPKKAYEKFDMDELKMQTSFAIFEELGLLIRNEKGLKLLASEGKKLEDSKVFCKGEKLRPQKQEILEFYDYQLEQTVVEFWNVINEKIHTKNEENNISEIAKSSEIAEKLAQTHVHER